MGLLNLFLFFGVSGFFFVILPQKDLVLALVSAISGIILVILSSILAEEARRK